MYRLTEEGRRYLQHGLPERRLLSLLEKPRPLADLKGTQDFAIGLQWAKKNDWIEIKNNKVIRKVDPGNVNYPVRAALKAIDRNERVPNEHVDQRLLDILVKRKLIQEMRDDIRQQAERKLKEGVQALTPELIATGLWKKASFKPYNVSVPGKEVYPGKRHPYSSFLSSVRRRFVELGFREMAGPLIETEFWNFDALFQPQNHPSRDWTQTYSLKSPGEGSLPGKGLVARVKRAHESGWRQGWDPRKASRLMPRAHATALSARTLASLPEIPGKYFAIARCFRPDVIDATHGVEFNQAEGIVIDPSLDFRHLLGLLKLFAEEFAGASQVKFIPDYYPFTEPSVQLSVEHPALGWVELGGAGIFREELARPLGVTEPVIAWGLGIDRLAMVKLGIRDIRQLFSRDLGWLRESRVI